jgi:hypothetical protein
VLEYVIWHQETMLQSSCCLYGEVGCRVLTALGVSLHVSVSVKFFGDTGSNP